MRQLSTLFPNWSGFEGARLQACRTSIFMKAALAAEGLRPQGLKANSLGTFSGRLKAHLFKAAQGNLGIAVALLIAMIGMMTYPASAQQLRAPSHAAAGTGFAISTSGSGSGMFYLLGPSSAIKKKIQLGSEVQVDESEARSAGRYTAIVCDSSCSSVHFFVAAAEPDKLSFVVHPSRVPVGAPDAISAVAFAFDKYRNLVLVPTKVDFHVTLKGAPAVARSEETKDGIAWMRLASTKKGGPADVVASLGSNSDKRIVQQVPSDACNLRIHSTRKGDKIEVETDPVRDCSGNAVPDGTIVSFTATDAAGKSTVDAPLKKGIAKAEMPIHGEATVSVASGVAIGNEIKIGGGL